MKPVLWVFAAGLLTAACVGCSDESSTDEVNDGARLVLDPAGGMAYDGRYLYIGDRSTSNTGVVVIDPQTNTKVGSTLLGDGMPPYSVGICRIADTDFVVVGTSDYMSGNLGVINAANWSCRNNLKSIHNDNKVVGHGSSVYVLELYGQDRAARFEGVTFDAGAMVWQAPMGSGVNVHDIAVAGPGKAYVTRYQSASMLVIDPASGATIGTVDLSAYGVPGPTGGAASLPYMHAAMVIGDWLYVQCQRLTIQQGLYGPTPMPCDSTGLLVVISVASDSVAGVIRLLSKNPASMDTAGGVLYVASSGSFYEVDGAGGIERVDLSSGVTTLVLSEQSVGGDISNMVLVNSAKGYVQVMDTGTFTSSLIEFDPQSGAVRDTL